uniref:Reverse transcriptase domain-containing protein n=1 Tax=Tanacetum cinerariifolium TaxID=118510 RepID=A0A6L2K2T3_TANCI|nr:hypothetical protein [Tanacetum cinerariifolium]
MSIQEMEDLKQQYFDEMKRLINSEYRDEIKIDELKGNFNSMSIEINKKEKLLQLEQLDNLSTYPSKCLNSFCYDDDDEDYTIAVTPILSIEEPDNSLSMRDEHLDTILATESDEVIKSIVEDLISILSESEGIPDTMCDVHLVNNPTPLEAKDHFEIVINSNDDYSSSNDDYLYNENIEYVEASLYDSELVSLEVAKIVIPKDKEIEDDNLREKLLKVNLLIAKIKALKDNPSPSFEFLTKSSSTSPISFLEKTNTFDNSLPELKNFCFDLEEISSGNTTTHSDISLPNYEAFSFYDDHIEEISSGSTTTHSDISLSEYDSFIFDFSNDQFPPTDRVEPNSRDFTMDVVEDISLTKEPQVHNALPTHPNLQLNMKFQPSSEYLFTYVVWIFLPFLVYSVSPHYLLSLRNEDTIFDPGICNSHFSKPDISHRCGTFPRFKVLPESPMEIFSSTCSPMDK